jgi:hypothetical protein
MSNQVYNDYMTRNHFSKRGGPYFVNDGFPKYEKEKENKGLGSIPIIGRISALLKFPRFKRDK